MRCNAECCAVAAIAVLVVAGCAKGSDQSTSGSSTAMTTASSAPGAPPIGAPAVAQGDPARGKTIFRGNCAACHGPTGNEGGAGPSLTREKSRKNYAETVAWVKDPAPPMIKLYPATLNERMVEDVAAYVQTL